MEPKIIESNNDPLQYPWTPPPQSVVVDGFNEDGTARTLPLIPQAGRRIGYARVLNPDGTCDSFDTAARLRNQLWSEYLYPVVAVGSNACPDVMLNKLNRRNPGGSLFFPIVQAEIRNLGIGFFARIGARGYIAATPYHHEGKKTKVWVSWLTIDQFKALDSTEPGYTCRLVTATQYPLTITSPEAPEQGTETLEKYYIYDDDEGYIVDRNGTPIALCSQTELFQRLHTEGVMELFASSPNNVVEQLAASEQLRDEIATRLRELNLVRPTGINAAPTSGKPIPYRDLKSLNAASYARPDGKDSAADEILQPFLVQPSPDELDRTGEQNIVVNSEIAKKFGEHVAVGACARPFSPLSQTKYRPPVVVRVISDPNLPVGIAQVDQAVRDGLGIGVNEYVFLSPAQLPQTKIADALCGRRYFMARAQTADHTNLETDIALLTPLMMSFLGIQDGYSIVIEGVPLPDGKVPEIRMKAVAMSDEVAQRREEILQSTNGLYASARKLLGVYPDISPLLIDRSARCALNIADHQLVPVRIRVSRRFKFIDELRELMLILFIAFIGVISLVPNPWVAIGLTLLLCLLAVMLTISRVRSSIGRVKTKRSQRRLQNPGANQ